MAVLLGLWLVGSLVLFGWAVTSPWVPLGEVPSQQQIDQAHMRVVVAGVVSVGLPAAGFVLAVVKRRDRWAMLELGIALICLFMSRVLWGLLS